MRHLTFFIAVLLLFLLASDGHTEQILICDLVSSQSSTGSLLDSLYSHHGYDVESTDHIPPSDSFPAVTIIWAGVPEYCFSYTLTEVDTQRVINALRSGKYIWAMGQEPLFDAWLERWFGFDILTWDPLPLDTLYGVDWNFLRGCTWLYEERPFSTYAIAGHDGMNYREEWNVLEGGPYSPGARGCRAVAYPDSVHYYKTLVLNIDLSRIIESDTFATVEDFALKVMRDWFELWPVGVEEKGTEVLPGNLYLSNYPNPFNATTAIRYELPFSAQVRLQVYNLLGEKVATLLNQRQEAGRKTVVWDASGFSSGLYFYRLTAGEFTETKTMMLVK
jgi:hypothetical protein